MYKKLGQLASVVSGYTFRGSLENDPKGGILVLQARNISANEDVVDVSNFTAISDSSLRSPYFLEPNDILLVSRGSGFGSFRSAIFASDEAKVMPSSSVHVIRLKSQEVLPKYVCYYLNSEAGQKALLKIVTGGSYIQSILVKNLSDFEIPIPPVHIQKLIISLYENLTEQDKIYKRKQVIRQIIINSTFKG